MKQKHTFLITCSLLFMITYTSYGQSTAVGFTTGFNRGFGVNAHFTIKKIAEGLPGNLRFGIGYNNLNPGKAADARKIFINNATNGVPKKKGKSFDYRLDYMMPYSILNLKNSYLVFGPRYSSFTANFNYIGGNEDFDVTAKQWGIGIGAENYFKMSSKFDLIVATGLDYFFNSTLKGHDTQYSPNDDNVNAREDYEFKDANKAIKQPQFMPRLMIGLSMDL